MIELKKDAPDAIDCKVYPMLQMEDQGLKDFLNEQLVKGYIRPSKSLYASSFFLSQRRTENYALSRTTTASIVIPFATNILFPSSLTFLPTFVVHTYTPNWTFTGDIIMCV